MRLIQTKFLDVIEKLNRPKVFPFFLVFYVYILTILFMFALANLLPLYLIITVFMVPILIRFPIIETFLLHTKRNKVKSSHVLNELNDQVETSGRNLRIIIKETEKLLIMVTPFRRLFVSSGFLNSFGEVLDEDKKKEIRAIMGHEFTHLEQFRRYIGEYAFFLIFLQISILILDELLGQLNFYRAFVFYSLVFLSVYLILFGISRRNEYRADRGSVTMGNDPDSLICGLFRVYGNLGKASLWMRGDLGKMSLSDGLNEIFDHHPHLLHRIEKLRHF